ncbi:MAG: tRNA (guanosine(37)-N1)-methyltransferase TrmD [bacterium]|nr:tRNA (guanosine(37)-N1)-methyltransferase TrmD [bacterium]
MKFDIITIFPNLFEGFKKEALIARGIKKKIILINAHNLRDWTHDNHKTVDDKPYGGGVGMVLKTEPIYDAVQSLERKAKSAKHKTKVILFSPRGKKFDQKIAQKYAKLDNLIMICGRYEGVDERVAKYIADDVISVGDYVLSGGEVPAMLVMEAVSRLVPGFIAKKESADKKDHAQYTRPEEIKINGKKRKVPEVLLSGNHEKIKKWRENL